MLKPIAKKRLADGAVEQLETLIREKTLKPGDRLPAERSLIDMLAISRASVREALRILEIKGLIEVKPGSGAYVRHPRGDLHLSLADWLPAQGETLQHQFEARQSIEPAAAALAAQRASRQQVKNLRRSWEQFSGMVANRQLANLIRVDIEFHRLIAVATSNTTLIRLMDTIARSLFEGWKGSLRAPNRISKTVDEHLLILRAIEKGNPRKAKQAMSQHLKNALADIMLASRHLKPEHERR